MSTNDLVDSALKLAPAERFELVDKVLQSLDQTDPVIDRVWLDEAERRLAALRSGKVQGVPAESFLGTL